MEKYSEIISFTERNEQQIIMEKVDVEITLRGDLNIERKTFDGDETFDFFSFGKESAKIFYEFLEKNKDKFLGT